MTVINHKSISGITSITAPAGSDDLLTVHTNDTTERFRIVDSGAIVTGVTTASNFKTGTSNLHNVGVEVAGINVLGADTPIGTGATIYDAGGAVFTGVVTATSFKGSITDATGYTTISNNNSSRVVTGTSTANEVLANATLTYDGTTLQNLQSSGAANLTLKTTSNSFNSLILDSNRAADTQFAIIDGRWNGNVVNRIQFVSGSDGTNKDDGYMAFHTRYSGNNLQQRVKITADGKLGINGNFTPAARVEIRDTIGGGGGTGVILNDIGSSGALEGLHIEWRSGSDKQSDQVRIGQKAKGTGSGSDFFIATNHQDTGSSTERFLINHKGGHNFYNDNSYAIANLTECNSDNVAINIRKTRQGQTKGIAIGAIGTNTQTGLQAYDSSDNSANHFTLNRYGGFIGVGVQPTVNLHVKSTPTADTLVKIESESGYDARLQIDTSNGGGAGAHVDFQVDGTTKGGIEYVTNASSASVHDMIFRTTANTERFRIDSNGDLTNTLQATSFVTTKAFSNLAKLDIRGTNIADSNHYILSYGEGHANDHEFHMVNTVGHLVFRTGTGTLTERVRINSAGEMSIGGQHADHAYDANSYGNPSLLIAGDDNADILTLMNDDPSPNNGDYASLGFRVAGQSTGSYAKAAIIAERNGGYNAIDLVFACGTDADNTRTTTSHEIMRVNHTRTVRILSNSTDNDFKNQNYPGDTSGIKLQNWPSSNTTGAFVSSTYALKAGNGTAQVCAWTAQSTATGTVPDMFYSVRTGDAQQHIIRIGGNDIGRGMEISNNITLTGSRNSNIVNERLRILPSENDGYDDSHILSAAQTAGNWEQGAGASYYDSSWGWLWQYASANNATRQIRAGIAYDHKGIEEFKYWSSYGAHTWYVDSGTSGNETAETCDVKAMQIGKNGGVINTAQARYGIYTLSNVWTTNQGQKNVQYLEDCYGQWIVVAKIQQSSHMQANMSSVTQIDTSTGQATGTQWSAAWGDSYPSEVRFVSSSNWNQWRDNRGVDFIYGVPNGRQWKKFFTDNGSSGMTHGGNHWGNNNRWGFTIAGGYDGFGRYHNPNYAFLRVSDGNLTTVTNTFFTTAGQTMDMDTANDAKFSFHATAVSSGQDCDNHQSYGYDDATYAHKNTYPATFSNHNGTNLTAMPLWVCIKLDHNKEN